MPATRQLVLTYGTFSTNGDPYHLDGPITIRKDRTTFEVSTRIVVAGPSITSAATFTAACAALEAAFRLERQDLTLTLSGENRVRVREGVEGYDAEPSATQSGTIPGDTGRSAVYEVAIRGKLTEPLPERAGLASLEWTADVDAACKGTLRVSGLYTRDPADPSTGSRAAYTAGITARVQAILTLLGGTWVRIDTTTTTDLDDDETQFALTYRERVAYLTGALDNPDLSDVTIEVTRRLEAPGDAGADVRRLKRFSASFTCAVCHTGSTTLEEAGEAGVTTLLAALESAAGGPVAVSGLDTRLDEEGSRVAVSIEAAASGGAPVVERRVTTADQLASNAAILDTWTDTGDAEAYTPGTAFVLKSPVTIERTLTVEEITLASVTIPGPKLPASGQQSGGAAFGFGFGEVQARGFDVGAGGGPFGFGQVVAGGFRFDPPPAAGAGAGGAEQSSAPQGGGAPSGPTWVFVRAAPSWDEPLTVGLPGVGTPIRLTRTVKSTTWRLVRPESSAGAPSSGNPGGFATDAGRRR